MNTGKIRGRNKRRRRLFWAGVAVIVFGLAGCTVGKNEEIVQEEPVTLRVIHSSGDIRWTGSMEWVAEQFMEENSDIQVELVTPADVAGQSFTDRLKVLIAQDEFYDVVELREASQFAGAGYLASLPDRLTSLIAGREEGEVQYYIPRYTTTQGMIYNRALFLQMSLSVPESYEDFLEICEVLHRAGISPIAVGGADAWHMGFWGNYLYQNYLLDEGENSDWSRKRVEKMLGDFRDLSRKGYIESRFANVSDSQTVHELSSGSSAMLYSGPWMMDQMMVLNPQLELGFFYLPGRDGKVRAEVDNSVNWGISAECTGDEKRWEAAVLFLEFFYSPGIYEHVLEQMNGESAVLRPVIGEGTKAQQMVREAGKKGLIYCDKIVGDEETPDGFRSVYLQSLQEVLWGTRSVESIARELEEQWRKDD